MSRFEVRVEGMDRLQKKLLEVPGAMRRVMERAVKFAHGEARVAAKPHPADKGTLAQTVKFEIAPGPVPLHARVFSRSGIAFTVEEGRRPGKAPTIARIRAWLVSHGIHRPPLVVVREIAAKGTKGVKFMDQALKGTQRKLPELIREAARDIEARWR